VRKAKITAKKAAEFIGTAELREKLWDNQLSGFHLVKLKTCGSWRIIYRTSNGRERSYTVGRYPALTADQARKLAHEARGQVFQGDDPMAKRQAVKDEAIRKDKETLGAYLDGPYVAYQRRKKTGHDTLAILNRHFGSWRLYPMGALKRSDVERWQADKESEGLSYPTIKRAYGALQTLLNHAARGEAIAANPLKEVSLERPAMTESDLVESNGGRRYLEESEVTALFAGIDAYQEQKRAQRRNSRAHGKPHLENLDDVPFADHVKPWLLLMYYTGFRPGDIYGLRWEHINLAFSTITKTIEKTAHHQPEPRTFPVCQQAIGILRVWWEQKGKPGTGYVFPSDRTGRRMDKKAMSRPWKNIKRLAVELEAKGEIASTLPENLAMYSLRHNFASQLIMGGADLLTVSKLMAHTDIQTTIEHYGHLRPDHARDYVNAFGEKHTPDTAGELKRYRSSIAG